MILSSVLTDYVRRMRWQRPARCRWFARKENLWTITSGITQLVASLLHRYTAITRVRLAYAAQIAWCWKVTRSLDKSARTSASYHRFTTNTALLLLLLLSVIMTKQMLHRWPVAYWRANGSDELPTDDPTRPSARPISISLSFVPRFRRLLYVSLSGQRDDVNDQAQTTPADRDHPPCRCPTSASVSQLADFAAISFTAWRSSSTAHTGCLPPPRRLCLHLRLSVCLLTGSLEDYRSNLYEKFLWSGWT